MQLVEKRKKAQLLNKQKLDYYYLQMMTVYLENPNKSTKKISELVRFQSVGWFQDTQAKIDAPPCAISNQ